MATSRRNSRVFKYVTNIHVDLKYLRIVLSSIQTGMPASRDVGLDNARAPIVRHVQEGEVDQRISAQVLASCDNTFLDNRVCE